MEVTSSYGRERPVSSLWIQPVQEKGSYSPRKQQHQCKTCGRQLTANPLDRSMASEQRLRIEPLLRERLSLRGICRAVGVSLTWLLHCMVEGLTTCPDDLHLDFCSDLISIS